MAELDKKRCEWAKNHPLMQTYHDNEWGGPVHDDRKHFEFMVLDLFQAGLSWLTILKKREGFRKAFDNFDYNKIAVYDENKVKELLADAAIIRNRLKINSTISNARLFIEVKKEFGSFDNFIWKFVKGKTIQNSWKMMSDLPVSTTESDDMSRDLKKRGFKFAGSTICYSYMQAAGMVNDHNISCKRYKELGG